MKTKEKDMKTKRTRTRTPRVEVALHGNDLETLRAAAEKAWSTPAALARLILEAALVDLHGASPEEVRRRMSRLEYLRRVPRPKVPLDVGRGLPA